MHHMFLNGTAMSGQKHHNLIDGASLIGPARTAARYRFVAIRDQFPALFPVREGGAAIIGELYEMSDELLFGSLLPQEPPELELGTIELEDGRKVNAMLLRTDRLQRGDRVVDISALGDWRSYQRFLADNDQIRSWL